jgi:hypothetical protein
MVPRQSGGREQAQQEDDLNDRTCFQNYAFELPPDTLRCTAITDRRTRGDDGGHGQKVGAVPGLPHRPLFSTALHP